MAATQTLDELAAQVDDVVCVLPTRALFAIGQWYADFHQVPDDDVVELLERARGLPGGDRPAPPDEPTHA